MREKSYRFGLLLIWALFLSACAAGGMKNVEQSGFLHDYSQLKPGGEDRAALIYVKPGVDFKRYKKLMFERIVVALSPKATEREIDPTILKEMADYYQNALFNAVKDEYEIVDQPGPDVAWVRVAITDIVPSKPAANTLSSIIPIGMALSAVTKAASDANLGTGEAATEIEVLDSVTKERLAAAIDRRQGGKMAFRGKWEDTKQAFDYWAKRFRERLDEARQ
jgi:hypothetical protein